MSKININIEENGTPEAVKNLMQEFVNNFENHNSDAWIREVKKRSSEHHCKILLKEGRCDFDNPSHGLTSEELICLYNYYYFPMHFQSSYWLFDEMWNKGFEELFITNYNPIFIDFGCGTLASSIAFMFIIENNLKKDIQLLGLQKNKFNEFSYPIELPPYFMTTDIAQMFYKDIGTKALIDTSILELNSQTYVFIDTSNNVLDFARNLMSRNQKDTFEVSDGHFIGWINLTKYNYIQSEKNMLEFNKHTHSNNSIIINFSYVFASESLVTAKIVDYVVKLISINPKVNICVFYQNPDLDQLNTKWEEFKEKVPFKSIAKGVKTIKHYENSKIRYEVLFKSKFDNDLNDSDVLKPNF